MNKGLIILIALVFISCNNKVVFVDSEHKVDSQQELMEPTEPKATEVWEPKPKVVTVHETTKIPSDAIVLFNGENFNEWESSADASGVEWILNSDKSMTVKNKAGDIQTKRNFGDIQLHLEWKSSEKIKGKGQSRSNSGVFIQGRYEVQVLDNNNNETYVNGQVGSIYKQSIPLAQASSKIGHWNIYDIIYHAPVFSEAGDKTKAGTITVLHNGVLIQDHYEIKGSTAFIGWPKNTPHGKAPIKLQDHRDNSGVSYRNIWVREL